MVREMKLVETELSQFLIYAFLLVRLCSCYSVIESTSGSIEAGDVTYFSIESVKPVIVTLVSTEGDVDLYASPTSTNSKPSGINYEFCSTSCGLDLLMIPLSREITKYTLGVFGHIRYEQSFYNLYIIEPSDEDVKRFQIWDWDYEKGSEELLIDADHMVLLNDPVLIGLVQQLNSVYHGQISRKGTPSEKQSNFFKDAMEFGGSILLKLLEVGIEILAA